MTQQSFPQAHCDVCGRTHLQQTNADDRELVPKSFVQEAKNNEEIIKNLKEELRNAKEHAEQDNADRTHIRAQQIQTNEEERETVRDNFIKAERHQLSIIEKLKEELNESQLARQKVQNDYELRTKESGEYWCRLLAVKTELEEKTKELKKLDDSLQRLKTCHFAMIEADRLVDMNYVGKANARKEMSNVLNSLL